MGARRISATWLRREDLPCQRIAAGGGECYCEQGCEKATLRLFPRQSLRHSAQRRIKAGSIPWKQSSLRCCRSRRVRSHRLQLTTTFAGSNLEDRGRDLSSTIRLYHRPSSPAHNLPLQSLRSETKFEVEPWVASESGRSAMSAKLSAETVDFIRGYFNSVWALELLLLMRREQARAWSVGDLIRELRASDLVVSGILPEFTRKGLVAEIGSGQFRYSPVSQRLGHLVDRVASAYAANRVRVTEEILNAPNDKIQIFADAFKLKKDR